MAKGIMGKYLHVNLSKNTIIDKEMPLEHLEDYIGGMGIASKIILEYMQKYEEEGINLSKLDPFAPENIFLLNTGPGTGVVGFPSSGRHHIMTMKSPLTGSIGSANSGGNFGAYLKRAGYDGIVVEGKAKKPVYLTILNNKVKIRSAEGIWGKDIFETNEIINEKHEDSGFKLSIAAIAQPGEQLSPISGVINDVHRAAGRTGVGAVMGSKLLKAIVVGGSQKVEVNDINKFKEISKESLKKIKENGVSGEGLPTYGTAILVNIINETGAFPTRNWQESYFEEAEKISGQTLTNDYLIKNQACWGCNITCGRKTKVKEGPYAIEETEGPEYESIWALGADCGISDMGAIIMANHICDKYSIDTITFGSTVACAMELAENGYLPREKYEGIDLKFGNSQALVDCAELTGQMKGFGKELAMGSYWLAEKYGHPELSMTVKKLEMPAYDPRGIKGIGLNYATANRGGCHVTGYTISPEIIGMPEQIDRLTVEGKANWVKIFQDFTAVVNSTTNCLFTTFALGAPDYANLLNAVTGWNLSVNDIFKIGDRIYSLQRLIMQKLGMVGQDQVPRRLFEEPIKNKQSNGEIFDLNLFLPEYYKLRGYDKNGVPTEKTLDSLGITGSSNIYLIEEHKMLTHQM